MRKSISKKLACLAALALILVGSLNVERAMAYFTAFDTAKGAVGVDLGFTITAAKEDVEDGKKEITITNTGDYDCYVRLKALVGDEYRSGLLYSEPDNAGKWTPGTGDYYYYNDILPAGGTTSQIDVSFVFPEEKPADFNVIIIQECTPVLYDENGIPFADWDVLADVSQSIYQ